MKRNHNHHTARTPHTSRRATRRLRRMEAKLDILLTDLNSMHLRLNWLQAQINSRNKLEMDAAIDRLNLSAKVMKDMADKELQAVRERYGTHRV